MVYRCPVFCVFFVVVCGLFFMIVVFIMLLCLFVLVVLVLFDVFFVFVVYVLLFEYGVVYSIESSIPFEYRIAHVYSHIVWFVVDRW